MVEPNLEDYRSKYSHIDFQREDGILEMTLHTDGDSLIWGFEPHEELGFCFADVGADPENEVIILTGAGEAFCDDAALGGDGVPPEMWMKTLMDGKRLLLNHLEIPAPMIAAINGPASVHAELALLCDVVLASEDTFFQDAPHFPNALVPGDGVQVVWPQLLGLNHGRYFLLTGEKLSAEEAKNLGVVSEIMPREELMPRARELARQINERPSLTVRLTREAMLQDIKGIMRENLGYGIALASIAGTDYWPSEFDIGKQLGD